MLWELEVGKIYFLGIVCVLSVFGEKNSWRVAFKLGFREVT